MARPQWVTPEPLLPRLCKNCGEDDLEKFVWHVAVEIDGNVTAVDGRLRLNDVAAVAYLGCETCSETLRVVSAQIIEDIMDWGTHA